MTRGASLPRSPGADPALDAVRDRFLALLDAERRALQDEIRAYPPPIPACDAQFNALTERRSALAEARHAAGRCGDRQALSSLLASTVLLSAERRERLLTALRS